MYHTTGFDREEVIDLCIRINSVRAETGPPNWPPCLGLFKSVVATLTYMRHNRTQAEIGESLGVSQPTISHHMKVLHEAGLVDRDKRGVWVYYRALPQALSSLGALIGCPPQ